MKIAPFLALTILVGLAATAPTKNDEIVVITKKLFNENFVYYTAEHDIVSLTVPLNSLNFDETDDDIESIFSSGMTIFFTEADVDAQGNKDYKGLYVLKDGKATKLLEHGTDTAADNGDSKLAYFGARDGLYVYNPVENKAEKYGTVTNNIISLVKENGTDVIYILTDNYHVYKVTEEGTKKERIDKVKDAHQIVLDFSNNLYYYGADKQPYVVTADGVKKIEGLPANPTYVSFVKPYFVIEDGVFFVSDQKIYTVYVNGTSELQEFELEVKPTAYAGEATLVQYYAYDKKIYEYNILTILLGDVFEEMAKYLEEKKDEIQSIKTRSRSELKA